MADPTAQVAVREALLELQRYLSDELAPMMVTDSVEVLLQCPPQIVASEIQGWVGAQSRGPASEIGVSDYLFHAVKKIHLMSEFHLIELERMEGYIRELGEIIVGLCPADERETLRESLGNLGQGEAHTAAPVNIVHRQVRKGGGAKSAAAPSSEEVARAMKRLSVLEDRLVKTGGAGAAGGEERRALESQMLATAAVGSRSNAELDRNLQHLSGLGIEARLEQVFHALGRSLPNWAAPFTETGERPVPTSRPAKAMHRIVSMAENPEESAKRFHDMVLAAIERFNEGALAKAVTMFDLAEGIISEKMLSPEVVRSIRERTHETLDPAQLRECAEMAESHASLRRVLDFFPAFSPKRLLDELHSEPRRERRKLILSLFEVHGDGGRSAALERLKACVDGDIEDPEGYLRRNIVFLLRRIPPPGDAPSEREIDLLIQVSKPGNPLILVREAIVALARGQSPRAEQVLIARLREFEGMLLKGEAPYPTEDLLGLLDRTVSALARLGTRNAWRTVVGHAFKQEPKLGGTMARLEDLQGQDLSGDGELVERLVETLRRELPSKVLGFVVNKKNPTIGYLIHALSGTPAPAVRQVFDEIVNRFPGQPFAELASRVVTSFGSSVAEPKTEPATSISGDLELFGLPNLLQTLADSKVTGVLTLSDPGGGPTGTISFDAGRICGCATGKLRGEIAFYQLFEKPAPGSFGFARRAIDDEDCPPQEVLPLVLEAMRRHDEFQEAKTLVPGDSSLKVTGTKPTAAEDETDSAFMQQVWSKVTAGSKPDECEEELLSDSYRIRRLLAHWVEEGALQVAS